jgi:hypothetical protein
MNSLVPVLLFLAVAVGLFLDLGVAVAFPRFYWRTSIPVLVRTLTLPCQPSFECLADVKSNNRLWTIRWLGGPNNLFRIGFRERAFGLATLYTPLIHGEVRSTQNGDLALIGRLNWYPIGFSIGFAAFSVSQHHFDLLIGVIPVLGGLFLLQRYRFGRLAERVVETACGGKGKHA